MSDFKDKYLKYKLKYLRLKENNNNLQKGGVGVWNSTPIDFVNIIEDISKKLGDYDIQQWDISLEHRDAKNNETCKNKEKEFFDNIQSTLTYVKTKKSPFDNAVPPYVIPEIPKTGKQVVLGTLELIKPYFLYNEAHQNSPFLMLSADANTWSEDLNASFIICSLYNLPQNPQAPYTVRLVLPTNIDNLIAQCIGPPCVKRAAARITLKELFLLRKIFIELQLADKFNVYKYEPEHPEFDIYFFKPK
jgi:hypothetical protein